MDARVLQALVKNADLGDPAYRAVLSDAAEESGRVDDAADLLRGSNSFEHAVAHLALTHGIPIRRVRDRAAAEAARPPGRGVKVSGIVPDNNNRPAYFRREGVRPHSIVLYPSTSMPNAAVTVGMMYHVPHRRGRGMHGL